MKHTTIAVDVAKSVFEIAISHRPGHVAETHRVPRARFSTFFAARKDVTVVMEACGSAHYWGRVLQDQGHQVVLLPPHAVRPYVVRNKTDQADAKEILEAFRNRDIHLVPVKSVSQQALAALRSCALIGSPRADSTMARSNRSSTERPEIRLQSNSIA